MAFKTLPHCDKEDCFACVKGRCTALTRADRDCHFYKEDKDGLERERIEADIAGYSAIKSYNLLRR